VRNPPARVAELAGGRDVDDRGLHSDRQQLAAADLLGPLLVLGLAPVLEKVLAASLMHDVSERPDHDQNDHEDDVALHDRGRDGRREAGERIAG
jgi:hypothetical protein